MCLADRFPERHDVLPEPTPGRRVRRRIQPLTWIVTAALMPVLLYDVWQTVQDVKQHHAARAYDVNNRSSVMAKLSPHRAS